MAIGFVDKEAGYAENELSIYNTKSGNKENEPNTSQDVSLWGVTDSEQARRLGMYKFAVTKNRPIVHKFSCDFEYLLCSKGDWIKYAGDIALAGLKQGRIAEVIYDNGNVTGFVADEVLPMEAGKSYAVRIRKNNAEIVLYKLKTSPGNNLEVFFDFPLSGSGLNEGDLFAFGLVNTETIDLIITDIQPGENLSADITAVEYSPAIFDVDKPDFVLPDFENKITPVPGAVDSGEISGWNTKYPGGIPGTLIMTRNICLTGQPGMELLMDGTEYRPPKVCGSQVKLLPKLPTGPGVFQSQQLKMSQKI